MAKIKKDSKMILAALSSYDILYTQKVFKTPEEEFAFLMSFRNDLIQLITLEFFNKFPDEPLEVLRHFFQFYASHDELLIEGLKFYSSFPDFIKVQKFNSIKAFLFYFAYQTKKYCFPLVKELLGQELLNVNVVDPKVYLEFCMFCFYKGLYYIEKKNYFMACYLYCTAVGMGIQGNVEDCKIFNNFSIQMLRSLCFLKSLTDFDIKNYLIKEHRRMNHENSIFLIKYEDINDYLNYILNEKDELDKLNTLVKSNKDLLNNHKLKGLKNEAEEALIFKRIKDTLCLYKKIKMGKLSQKCQIDFNDLMKVMKKKVISGEIRIKYDEATDEVEVFDVDPGLKERVQETKELYRKIIDGNKNLFINLRDKKMDEMSGGKLTKDEIELLNMRKLEQQFDEDYIEMDVEDDD